MKSQFPQVQEEPIVEEIIMRLGWAKIPMTRIRERIPGENNYRKSDSGIPDTTGNVPKGRPRIGNTFPADQSGEKYTFAFPIAQPVWIEVKRPGEMDRFNRGVLPIKRMKTIYEQMQFIKARQAEGCIAFFAESWEDVRKGFAPHGIILPGDR